MKLMTTQAMIAVFEYSATEYCAVFEKYSELTLEEARPLQHFHAFLARLDPTAIPEKTLADVFEYYKNPDNQSLLTKYLRQSLIVILDLKTPIFDETMGQFINQYSWKDAEALLQSKMWHIHKLLGKTDKLTPSEEEKTKEESFKNNEITLAEHNIWGKKVKDFKETLESPCVIC